MESVISYGLYVERHPYNHQSFLINFSFPKSDTLSYHVNEVLDLYKRIEKFRGEPMTDELTDKVRNEIENVLKAHANELGFTSYQSWLEELDKE